MPRQDGVHVTITVEVVSADATVAATTEHTFFPFTMYSGGEPRHIERAAKRAIDMAGVDAEAWARWRFTDAYGADQRP